MVKDLSFAFTLELLGNVPRMEGLYLFLRAYCILCSWDFYQGDNYANEPL